MRIDLELLLQAKADNLVRLAESLGIKWEGKTRRQLAKAIDKKINP